MVKTLDYSTAKDHDFDFDSLSPDNKLAVADLITAVELAKAVAKQKLVPPNHPLIMATKSIGVSFGE